MPYPRKGLTENEQRLLDAREQAHIVSKGETMLRALWYLSEGYQDRYSMTRGTVAEAKVRRI